MVKQGLILIALSALLFSCKKEEEAKPEVVLNKPKAEIISTSGDFVTGSNLSQGSAFTSKTCKWVVKYNAEKGISSYSAKINGIVVSGYPKILQNSIIQRQDTITYFVKPSDSDTLRFDFLVVDKKGDSAKTTYKLFVRNFRLFKDLYLFTQDVVAADTVGKNLKGATIGSFFSTLNRRTYKESDAIAAGNLIDLSMMGVDGGQNDGVLFVSNDRRSVLGGNNLPQALPLNVVLNFSFIETLSFYNIDWVTFNGYTRNYSNNAFVQTNSIGSINSQFNIRINNRCEGMIFVKEMGDLASPSTNTKKYIKFDLRLYYF